MREKCDNNLQFKKWNVGLVCPIKSMNAENDWLEIEYIIKNYLVVQMFFIFRYILLNANFNDV